MRNDDEQQPPYFPQGPQQADAYYPDLTMDMGSSLGYSQSIQHHSISMPQPTESLPRLRRERLQQLREERMGRQQRGADIPALSARKRQHDPAETAGNVAVQLSPAPLPQTALPSAAEPAQGTAEIQRVKVARASSLISGAFLLSSILGLVQTFLFTYIFGRSMSGEAYLQAYLIPNLIFTVIAGGALSSAFIPVFTSYALRDRDEKEAWHIASSALNLSVACMIALSLVAIFLTPVLVPLYSRPDEVSLIVTLTRIMLLQAVLLASGALAGIVLVMRFMLDHMIDTTSMPKLFIHGILMAILKLLIELVAGAAAFLIVARLLKMEEMNSGLVRRVIQLLRLPWL